MVNGFPTFIMFGPRSKEPAPSPSPPTKTHSCLFVCGFYFLNLYYCCIFIIKKYFHFKFKFKFATGGLITMFLVYCNPGQYY